MVWPPFVVLVLGALVASVLTPMLADSLRGDWFDMAALGYVIGGAGYALFAALFLWFDALAAAALPGATWPSRARMWWQTLFWVLPSLGGAFMLGATFFASLATSGQSDAVIHVMIVLAIGTNLAAIVTGGTANVRARRRTRIDPYALR